MSTELDANRVTLTEALRASRRGARGRAFSAVFCDGHGIEMERR